MKATGEDALSLIRHWKDEQAPLRCTYTSEGLGFSVTGRVRELSDSVMSINGTACGAIIPLDGVSYTYHGYCQVNKQLAMATFNNPKGLFKLGANLYGESGAAGLPNIGTAGSGGKGSLIGSALETSNVDIAEEFTKMILAQRGFQASARTITVSDELLLETLNLKR